MACLHPQADYVLLLGTLESQQRASCVKGSQSVQILSREKSHAQQWFCPQFLLPQSKCCLTGICLWFLILQVRRVMSVRTTPAIPDVRGGGDNNRVLSPLLLLIQPCEGDGTTPTISDWQDSLLLLLIQNCEGSDIWQNSPNIPHTPEQGRTAFSCLSSHIRGGEAMMKFPPSLF